jgi:flagellar motility protein MotE (MotC chaperone)
MNRWWREFRPMPIVLIAVGCLFALKVIGLIFDGGYTLGQHLGSSGTLVVTTVPMASTTQLRSPATALEMPPVPGEARRSWMQEMFNYPDVTGSVAAKPKEASKDAPKETAKEGDAKGGADAATEAAQKLPGAMADGRAVPSEPSRPASGAERALLERLQEKRQALETRARELDMRESLIKAAEKKLEAETAAQKAENTKAGSAAKDQAAVDEARFKGVVTMYEAMKPKDAAKIFDRLDGRVLLEVASQIKPQRMSEIMAQMSPENAERLTVELASRGGAERGFNPASLPKIEGKPAGR